MVVGSPSNYFSGEILERNAQLCSPPVFLYSGGSSPPRLPPLRRSLGRAEAQQWPRTRAQHSYLQIGTAAEGAWREPLTSWNS